MCWQHYGYLSSAESSAQFATTPGEMGAIILSANTGVFMIYDSASGSTSTPICRIGSTADTSVVLRVGVQFNEGLYVVSEDGSGYELTVLWNS